MTQAAKRALPALGRQQRLAMSMMYDQGYWRPGVPWGVGHDGVTARVCQSLRLRGLLAWDVRDGGESRYILGPAGYSWLIMDAAADLTGISTDSEAYDRVTGRLQHLAASARTARYGPANWRGERV